MKVSEIENIISQSLSTEPEECANQMSWAAYIEQCRTIVFGLPRRSGKTTLAEQYVYGKSALMIVDTHLSKSHLKFKDTHETLSMSEFINFPENQRGRHFPRGMKYQCIVFDEVHMENPEVKHGFFKALLFLSVSKLLTKDFHIVHFKTPRL